MNIYNSEGMTVFSRQLNTGQLELNITDYPNGIYFIKLANGQNISTAKFIKE